MLDIPSIAFVLLAFIAALAQRAFFNRVARSEGSVRDSQELWDEMSSERHGVPSTLGDELSHRIEVLTTRSKDQTTERMRWIVITLIVLLFLTFGWIAGSGGRLL